MDDQHPHLHVDREAAARVGDDEAAADVHADPGLGIAAVVPQPDLDARP